jgi:hypothetical protein
MKRLGFNTLLDSRRSRERDLVVAMVNARILDPPSKLATSRSWSRFTLAADLGVEGAHAVDSGRQRGAAKIGLRVGKVIGKYKVAKHFVLDIADKAFAFRRNEERIREEAALDGIYVVRTSLPKERASAADAVRGYKKLSRVERAFRTIKTADLAVRPIHHRLEDRVRAHIFLCVLTYYVEWHMRDALKPMLFADEMTDEEKDQRDPVAPAKRSDAALRKVSTQKLDDASPTHDFRSLLSDLSLVVRSRCRARAATADAPTFDVVTSLTATQRRAFELLEKLQMYPVR